MDLPTIPEAFTNPLAVAVAVGLLTAFLKGFIKGKIETEPGNPQLEGKADVLILGLVLLLGILIPVAAQCVTAWPPTPAGLFTAVMVGLFGAGLSSFGAKFVMTLFAWVTPNTQ